MIVEVVDYYGKPTAVTWLKTLKLERLSGPNTGGKIGKRTPSGALCMIDGQKSWWFIPELPRTNVKLTHYPRA